MTAYKGITKPDGVMKMVNDLTGNEGVLYEEEFDSTIRVKAIENAVYIDRDKGWEKIWEGEEIHGVGMFVEKDDDSVYLGLVTVGIFVKIKKVTIVKDELGTWVKVYFDKELIDILLP